MGVLTLRHIHSGSWECELISYENPHKQLACSSESVLFNVGLLGLRSDTRRLRMTHEGTVVTGSMAQVKESMI